MNCRQVALRGLPLTIACSHVASFEGTSAKRSQRLGSDVSSSSALQLDAKLSGLLWAMNCSSTVRLLFDVPNLNKGASEFEFRPLLDVSLLWLWLVLLELLAWGENAIARALTGDELVCSCGGTDGGGGCCCCCCCPTTAGVGAVECC